MECLVRLATEQEAGNTTRRVLRSCGANRRVTPAGHSPHETGQVEDYWTRKGLGLEQQKRSVLGIKFLGEDDDT